MCIAPRELQPYVNWPKVTVARRIRSRRYVAELDNAGVPVIVRDTDGQVVAYQMQLFNPQHHTVRDRP